MDNQGMQRTKSWRADDYNWDGPNLVATLKKLTGKMGFSGVCKVVDLFSSA